MTRTLTPPAPVSLAAFDAIFEEVKNWGRWGADDERGTLNYLTPGQGRRGRGPGAERAHASRWPSRSTRTAGPDNPNPAVHLMSLMHDIPVSASGLSFGMCFLGMASHGDCHTHVDALNHVAYRGQLYNGKPPRCSPRAARSGAASPPMRTASSAAACSSTRPATAGSTGSSRARP